MCRRRCTATSEERQYVELAARLIAEVDDATRAAVRGRLMIYPRAPASLLNQLDRFARPRRPKSPPRALAAGPRHCQAPCRSRSPAPHREPAPVAEESAEPAGAVAARPNCARSTTCSSAASSPQRLQILRKFETVPLAATPRIDSIRARARIGEPRARRARQRSRPLRLRACRSAGAAPRARQPHRRRCRRRAAVVRGAAARPAVRDRAAHPDVPAGRRGRDHRAHLPPGAPLRNHHAADRERDVRGLAGVRDTRAASAARAAALRRRRRRRASGARPAGAGAAAKLRAARQGYG